TGLKLSGAEPGRLIPKLLALGAAADTVTPAALLLGIGTVAVILLVKRVRPAWPGMLMAVVAAAAVAVLLHLPVETIGSRFGELPRGLPRPKLPDMSFAAILQVLPAALSFTLLGGIESLLSAKVADGMTKRKHRSNMELLAQGIANIASAVFGGISVTGTIARTATNIRAGARSPLAGIMHAAFVLLFLLVAAPLARYVPLPALAGILVVVCWNMVERAEIRLLLANWRGGLVLVTTFAVTVAEDLTAGIIAGCAVAAVLAAAGIRVPKESP
ncbi:MAG: SulP family inorganic anion transporter, partial [Rhodospirillaceae bacterium]